MITEELIRYVIDADFHSLLDSIEYSTSLREIVTVGYMIENHIEN